MEKLSNLSFGLSFSIFNIGLILSTYFDFGFNIVLAGGILSVISLISIIINEKFKDFDTLLIHLIFILLISELTLYTNNFPFDKQMRIAGLLLLVILIYRHLPGNRFQEILKHPFLNHPIIKIAIGLFIASKTFTLLHLDYVNQVYNLTSAVLIIWCFLKFIKPQISNVP